LEGSLVFIDDNPAEREIVRQQLPDVAVPEVSTVEYYIRQIDRQGYFEVIKLSNDDMERNDMYKANAERKRAQNSFGNYMDYLKSLEMKAVIKPFEAVYMSRIAQLTNYYTSVEESFRDFPTNRIFRL
jgi:predicted enzyme involved in methoxymalonyl-ACP biosynthesis